MKINLLENFRALFYAPFYATFALGAYEAEGLDVEMITSLGFGNSLRMLRAGDVDVSWFGPVGIMVARDRDPQAGVVAFCEVVARDPFMLVGRAENPQFRMQDLADVTLATVSEVSTPWVCLQYDLRQAGIDPTTIRRSPQRTMAENVTKLRDGEVDVIQLYHPQAIMLIAEGIAYPWYSAASRGPACYTTLNTTRRFIEKNPDIVLRMVRGTYRTQKWIAAHDGRDLAEIIAPYLPDVPFLTLAACCNEYKSSGVWSFNPIVQRAGLEWKRDAMLASGAIHTQFEYETYVDTRFAERVVREDPPSMPLRSTREGVDLNNA